MSITSESYNELKQMIEDQDLTGAQVRALIKEMNTGISEKAPRKSHPQATPVKHLTEIIHTHTCFTCGHRFTNTVSITNTESICTVDKTTGSVVIATAKHGPYTLDSWTRSCNHCDTFIDRLSIDELKERYKKARMFVPLPSNKEAHELT